MFSCPQALTDGGLLHLTSLIALHDLSLAHMRVNITDAGISHLSALTSLRRLSLKRVAGVTNDGLSALSGLTRLQVWQPANFRTSICSEQHVAVEF